MSERLKEVDTVLICGGGERAPLSLGGQAAVGNLKATVAWMS
jgi:hypothetical protein